MATLLTARAGSCCVKSAPSSWLGVCGGRVLVSPGFEAPNNWTMEAVKGVGLSQ